MSIYINAGDKGLAVDFMGLVGLNNVTITYNQNETIATVEDTEALFTLTFVYSASGNVDYIHDGTLKWTLVYDDSGRVASTLRTTL